ncbi:transposase [Bradyrhizobium diazoefficiens]|uniref:Putative transposase n=1 Tax=Bradyrhizobium diazoefficiens TaxID=1355477 RepID=A0A0E4BNS1_9BRAD|nr:putative transposase [Bradyrhizobium diazoefficiens]
MLEACCRSPVTLQRDLKRARIVLLAADGRSTRSIAKEVGVQPRIVSLWRHRYADHGLEGCKTSRGLASSRSIRRRPTSGF